MNKYKILITQRAYFDILECVKFVKNVSEQAGVELYDEIIDSLDSIAFNPHAFQEIQNLKIKDSKIRKKNVHNGRYFIIYKIEADVVTILSIFDARKDNWILKLLQ